MDSSVDAAHNVADPPRLILILALRTGAIQAKSVDDIITKALNRKDRVVQRAHPVSYTPLPTKRQSVTWHSTFWIRSVPKESLENTASRWR